MALCTAALKCEAVSTRTTGCRTVHVIDMEDGTAVVLKTARADRAATPSAEAWAYEACRRAGIAVPEVLAVIEEPEALIMGVMPGHPLSEGPSSAEPGAWAATGADLRAMHEIAVPGFGPLVAGAGGAVGVSPRWSPVIDLARDHGIKTLADRGLVTTEEAARLVNRYEELESHLEGITDGRLLHSDLEGDHVFIDAQGSYAGIIDFDQAQSGDPLWDLARIPLWDGPDALELLLAGYGRDTVTAEHREFVFPLYLLAFCIHHIVTVPFSPEPTFWATLLRRCGYERLL